MNRVLTAVATAAVLVCVLGISVVCGARPETEPACPVVPVPDPAADAVAPVPVPVPIPAAPVDVRGMLDAANRLANRIDAVAESTEAIREQLVSVNERVGALEAAPPAEQLPQTCTCDCPTVDEVRAVVREELDKTEATLKTAAAKPTPPAKAAAAKAAAQTSGAANAVTRPATSSGPQPGEVIIAIDGVPVHQPAARQPAVRQQGGGLFRGGWFRGPATCTDPGCN